MTGVFDVFFVDDFSFKKASSWGADEVEKYVMKKAKKVGYNGDNLAKAIKTLEDATPFAADKATSFFGGGGAHHLRDLSHHWTLVALIVVITSLFI